MRNIHMMLPPRYRDLWKNQFQGWKSLDVNEGRAWMYEADPFTAKIERDEARALLEKKREDREKQKAKEAQQPINLVLNNAGASSTPSNFARGWTRVPQVEMGNHTRATVEELIRKNAGWNPYAVSLSKPEKDNILTDLTHLGFRRTHVEEAIANAKTGRRHSVGFSSMFQRMIYPSGASQKATLLVYRWLAATSKGLEHSNDWLPQAIRSTFVGECWINVMGMKVVQQKLYKRL